MPLLGWQPPAGARLSESWCGRIGCAGVRGCGLGAVAALLVVVALVAVGVKYAGYPGKPVPNIDALLYSVWPAFLRNVDNPRPSETAAR